jgi:DNA-binding GntR family transcriptional regulator
MSGTAAEPVASVRMKVGPKGAQATRAVQPAQATPPLAAVRERVLEQLRGHIVSGLLRPGDRLVERDLAVRFGVSRVPVREAISILQSEGFVVAESPRRVVVRKLSRTDVEELFDVREALEVLACALAARRAGEDDLRRLESLLADTAQAIEAGRLGRVADRSAEFHERIIALAGSGLLSSMIQPLENRLRWLFRQNEDWARLLREHQRLLAAIASGDPERARQCSLRHVRENRALAIRLLFGEDNPENDTDEATEAAG